MTTLGELRSEMGVPCDGEPDELEVDDVQVDGQERHCRERQLILQTKRITVRADGSTITRNSERELTPQQIARWAKRHSAADINAIIDTAAERLVAEGISSIAAAKRLLAATGALQLGLVEINDE